ncbi:MAG: DNA polymerase III subunit beta [Bacteroidia bacterium]
MKFIASSSALQKHLQQINGVISTHAVIPILEYFLFEVEEGNLTITGTDLEVSMRSVMDVEAKEDGRIAIPARIIQDILKTLPDQPVTFTISEENNSIELTSDSGRYKIAGENPEDFPRFPEVENASNISLPAGVMERAITSTIFAVGTDELRPALTGLLFKLAENDITFVATDGNKLVKYQRLETGSESEDTFIVPKKALGILRNSLPDGDQEVKMEYNSVNALFTFRNIKLICRLIDERFPDYNAAIPKEAPNMLTMNRTQFMNALKRISIFSNKTTYQVKLTIAGSELQLNAQDIDFANEAHERLQCEYDGQDLEIAFNARFLIEMLSILDSDEVTIALSEYNRPGVLRPKPSEENEEILMLLMPIVVNV